MRAYAYVVPTFWTRGSGKKLRGNPAAQALALYVMTAPSSNMVGLYYVPLTTIAAETGIPAAELPGVFSKISEIAKYDFENEIVWVPEAAAHQIGETMKGTDKRRSQVIRDVEAMGSHPFALEFFAKYSAAYGLDAPKTAIETKPLTTKPDAPSEGLPPDRMPRSPDPVLSSSDGSDRDHEPDHDPFAASPGGLTGSARVGAPGLPAPAERHLAAMAEKMIRSRGAYMEIFGDTPSWPELQPIFIAFQETWGRNGAPAHGGDPRAQLILQRIVEGIPVERLAMAVRRSKFAAYIVADESYQTLTTILRDAAQVDKFCALTALPRKAGQSREPQTEGGDWKPTVEKRS